MRTKTDIGYIYSFEYPVTNGENASISLWKGVSFVDLSSRHNVRVFGDNAEWWYGK